MKKIQISKNIFMLVGIFISVIAIVMVSSSISFANNNGKSNNAQVVEHIKVSNEDVDINTVFQEIAPRVTTTLDTSGGKVNYTVRLTPKDTTKKITSINVKSYFTFFTIQGGSVKYQTARCDNYSINSDGTSTCTGSLSTPGISKVIMEDDAISTRLYYDQVSISYAQ